MQILFSNSQAGPGRTVKQEQEEISPKHIQAFIPDSVLMREVLPWGTSKEVVSRPVNVSASLRIDCWHSRISFFATSYCDRLTRHKVVIYLS